MEQKLDEIDTLNLELKQVVNFCKYYKLDLMDVIDMPATTYDLFTEYAINNPSEQQKGGGLIGDRGND